jgi:hypothetical protein
MTPYAFGEKVAQSFWGNYKTQFENLYGVEPRLPHDYSALRQLLIASTVGGGLGFGRGLLWPGYHEKMDAHGNIVAKKKRNPWLGALQGAALGAGTSALSNYASQTLAQYNPEIDKFLSGVKQTATNMLPVTATRKYDSVDGNQPLLDRITTTA